jgi:hypothetical protein
MSPSRPAHLRARRPSGDETGRRRALELLASCPDGCAEGVMLAHGFTIDFMVELVRSGLANATAERNPGAARDRGRAGADYGCGASLADDDATFGPLAG